MTYRQYLVWLAWLKEDWNRPSRTDHYIMQAARPHYERGTDLIIKWGRPDDLKDNPLYADVDDETWNRWEGKLAQLPYKLAAVGKGSVLGA